MTERVVVTGASGFVGRAVCGALVRAGADVHTVSRRRGDVAAGVTSHVVESYAATPGLGGILLHLAGESVASRVTPEVERLHLADVDALLGKGFRRSVFASSAVVYGAHGARPFSEHDPLAPVGRYAALKVALEARFDGARDAIARLANVYGAGQSSAGVLAHLLSQLDAAGPLTVRASWPVRDFVFIDDAAEALARLCLSDVTGPFNIGTGVGTSVEHLAQLVLEASGQRGRSVSSETQPDAPSVVTLNCDRAERELGWRARTPIAEGLSHLVRKSP